MLTVTLIALAGFSYVMVTVLYGYLLARSDDGLRAVLAQSKPLLVAGSAPSRGIAGGPSAGPAPGSPVHLVIPHGLVQYNVKLVTGQRPPREVVQGSTDLIPQLPGDLSTLAAQRGIQTVTSSNGHTQLRLLAAAYGDGAVIVTTSLEDLDSTSRQLSVMVTLGTLAAALLIFTGVGLVTRRALRPVEAMADEADQITAGDFTSRVSPAGSGDRGRPPGNRTERDARPHPGRRPRAGSKRAGNPAVLRRRQP